MDDTGELLATIFSVQPDNYYCGVYLHNSENCYGNLIFLQVCLGTQVTYRQHYVPNSIAWKMLISCSVSFIEIDTTLYGFLHM